MKSAITAAIHSCLAQVVTDCLPKDAEKPEWVNETNYRHSYWTVYLPSLDSTLRVTCFIEENSAEYCVNISERKGGVHGPSFMCCEATPSLMKMVMDIGACIQFIGSGICDRQAVGEFV